MAPPPSNASTAIDANSVDDATPLLSTPAATEASRITTPLDPPPSQATNTGACYNCTKTPCSGRLATETAAPVPKTFQYVVVFDQAGTITKETPSVKLRKCFRKSRLKLARETTDYETSIVLTVAIFNDWHGAGLHPLEAFRNLAALEIGLNRFCLHGALSVWFLIVRRYVELKCIPGAEFWKSIKQSKGCQARYFKAFDDALTTALFDHWHGLLKTSKEVEWDPNMLYLRLHSTFATIAKSLSMPDAFGTYGPELATLPPLFPNAFNAISMMMFRRNWIIKVERVAGHRLPRELVDMIVETTSYKDMYLESTYKVHTVGEKWPGSIRIGDWDKGIWDKGMGKDKYVPLRTGWSIWRRFRDDWYGIDGAELNAAIVMTT